MLDSNAVQADKIVSVKIRKPWTLEIYIECYFISSKKPIRWEKTKLQLLKVITCSLLFYADWLLYKSNQSVHGIRVCTVMCAILKCLFLTHLYSSPYFCFVRTWYLWFDKLHFVVCHYLILFKFLLLYLFCVAMK